MDSKPCVVQKTGDSLVQVVTKNQAAFLCVEGANPGFFDGFEQEGRLWAPQNHKNAEVLRKLFPFCAPQSVLKEPCSMGTGDRLGIATPGHIEVFRKSGVKPVLAQQSMRELSLTKRSYETVLDTVSYAVFAKDYREGFGADGDHLKTCQEVEYAIKSGCTMITLDCSEQIYNGAAGMSQKELLTEKPDVRKEKERYANKVFEVEEMKIQYTEEDLRRIVLIYGKALRHIQEIYECCIKGENLDFEISIDEVDLPTSAQEHFFVASELKRMNVDFDTIAPRFCGEFQKGIDYIGDLCCFERELGEHASIARYFGYKLSIHSGSDKFSVFSTIGRLTRSRFHLKTAGTSWLEAMYVVALSDATLYREVHTFALSVFGEACRYYHVKAIPEAIPSLQSLSDGQLPQLFEDEDARQLIHITYGLILNAKDISGNARFKDRLYRCWADQASLYEERIKQHIGRHLQELLKEC